MTSTPHTDPEPTDRYPTIPDVTRPVDPTPAPGDPVPVPADPAPADPVEPPADPVAPAPADPDPGYSGAGSDDSE